MSPAISNFCKFYRQLGVDNLSDLNRVYSCNVVFEDPAHRISGLDNITDYFSGMFENLSHCHFNIDTAIEQKDQAFIKWTMVFGHPRLGKGKAIKVPGVSHLQFDERVFFQ